MTLAEGQCLLFVRIWAEAVLRKVSYVREMRVADEQAFKAFERAEDWSPDAAELERRFRELWAEEHALVWAAHQLEKWTCRLAVERGQDAPSIDSHLLTVRNALEHLYDAEFKDVPVLANNQDNYQLTFTHAVAGEVKNNRALRKLVDGIPIVLGANELLGGIDPNQVEERALALVHNVDEDLEQSAADWAAEVARGR